MRASGPRGDDAQLARGGGTGLQLLRRDARFVDRQAVAARPRVAEQPVAGGDSPTTSAIAGRAGSTSCAIAYNGSEVSVEPDGERLPLLRQDRAADRQPGRRRPASRSSIRWPACPPTRRSRWATPSAWGSPHGWDEATFIAALAHDAARRHGRTRTCASAATASTRRCWDRCSRRRASAGARRAGESRRGAAETDLAIVRRERMTPMRRSHDGSRRLPRRWLVLAAPPRARRTRPGATSSRKARGQTRQLERLGRRREDQRLHRLGRRRSRAPLRRQGQARQAEGHRRGGDARRRRKGRRPRPRRQRRPRSGSTARTSSR